MIFTKMTLITIVGFLKMIPEDEVLSGVMRLVKVSLDYLYSF